VGVLFIIFIILFTTLKIVLVEKVSIIQDFVPYIRIERKDETDDNNDNTIEEAENDENIYKFNPNIGRFVDILDTKLSDILENITRLGETFARGAMDVEQRPDKDRSLKNLFSSMLYNEKPEASSNLTKPLHILLLSTWSSGSTFLTKLLTHYPTTFLTFEPMVRIKGYGAVENHTADTARRLLKDVFTCNYKPGSWGEKLLRYIKNSGYKVWALHNIRLRNVCEGLLNSNDYCYDPAYVSRICNIHPTQLVKTVRLRVEHVKQLLEEKALNLKIIALFRDPRAVISSRRGRSWCNFPSCNNVSTVCGDHDQDLGAARELVHHHPGRVIIAKYEELATQPKQAIPVVLKFLGLPWHPALTKFMADHMVEDLRHNKEGDLHTQSVNSSTKVDQWKDKLSETELSEITRTCRRTIENHEKLSMVNNT